MPHTVVGRPRGVVMPVAVVVVTPVGGTAGVGEEVGEVGVSEGASGPSATGAPWLLSSGKRAKAGPPKDRRHMPHMEMLLPLLLVLPALLVLLVVAVLPASAAGATAAAAGGEVCFGGTQGSDEGSFTSSPSSSSSSPAMTNVGEGSEAALSAPAPAPAPVPAPAPAPAPVASSMSPCPLACKSLSRCSR